MAILRSEEIYTYHNNPDTSRTHEELE